MSLLEGFKWYYELCGSRGAATAASFRMFGRPRELAVTPPRASHPVHLRLNTSDFCAYKDVLICQDKNYDPELPGFVPKTIVDVGAHIGMTSILLTRKYPDATIIAAEPERENFSALKRNTAPYPKITAIRAAIWKADGEVMLGKSNAHPKGAFQVAENGEQRIRAITIDTLILEAGIGSIDLLKVDIEGAEKDVFESCPWIKNVKVIAIELHDRIRPGCRATVERATRDFQHRDQGEITLFYR